MNVKTRGVVVAGLGYLVVLVAVVVGGALWFRDLYTASAPEPGTRFAPSYQLFLTVAGGSLAIFLGAVAGVLGRLSGKWWLGLGELLAGLVVTVAGLSVLPWVRFPHDQYAAAAAWMFSGAPVCVGLWLLLTAAGLFRRADRA